MSSQVRQHTYTARFSVIPATNEHSTRAAALDVRTYACHWLASHLLSSQQSLAASWTVLLSVIGLTLHTLWSVMSPGSSSTSAQQLSCGLPSLRSSRTCFSFRSRLSRTI